MKKIGMILFLLITLCLPGNSLVQPKPGGNPQDWKPTSSVIDTNIVYLPIVSRQTFESHYVSPNGDDANPGTYLQPWRTIGKAAQMVNPGDIVFIRGGVYNEAVHLHRSGTEDAPILIRAYSGETPIIDGYNQLPNNYAGLVSVYGDWVQVSGLEVRNSQFIGLGLYGKHDEAYNIFAHHSQKSGIYISGDYGVVEHSRIWRNSLQNEYGNSSSWSSGLIAGRDSTDGITEFAIMRENVSWENWGQGINTYEANGTIIEDNVSHDNFSTNIYISNATNILCQRNFVYMNPTSYVFGYGSNVGIMMGDEIPSPLSANIKVINNISYGNNWNLALWKGTQSGVINNVLIANNTFVNGIISGGIVIRGFHQDIRFENNIVQQDGPLPAIAISLDPDLSFSNNLWSKSPPDEASGPGDVIDDPMLAHLGDPYTSDWFRLTGISPAIDNAQQLPDIVVDYFTRVRGNNPDIGAIEFFP